MDIYVIRHGQTAVNAGGRMVGRTHQYALTELGEQQAEQAGKEIADLEYDIVICSPLQRAKRTCEIVNVKHKEVIYDDRLMERDCGVMEGMSRDCFDYEHYWNYHYDFDIKGMTPIKEFIKPIWEFLDEVKEKYKGKNVLIVTHNGVGRAIGAYFHGIPEDGDLNIYKHKNCQIKHYEAERS